MSATPTPLGEVVRTIMASGAAAFAELAAQGKINHTDSITDALGDFPEEFLLIRPRIVDDLRLALAVTTLRQITASIEGGDES